MFAGLHQTKDAVSRPRYFDPCALVWIFSGVPGRLY